jgi:nucleotide-binding universal stress UspA family protein
MPKSLVAFERICMKVRQQFSAPRGRIERRRRRALNRPPEPRLEVKRILVLVNFCSTGLQAVDWARRYAERLGASLILLHVIEPILTLVDFGYGLVTKPVSDPLLLKPATSKLRLLAESLRRKSPGLVVHSLVQSGDIATETLRFLNLRMADLLVLGVNRPAKSVGLDKCSESLLGSAPCPVMVVHS